MPARRSPTPYRPDPHGPPAAQDRGDLAILLPFLGDRGTVDWAGFRDHVCRTAEAGLVPAVNMDTGFVNRLERRRASATWTRPARSSATGRSSPRVRRRQARLVVRSRRLFPRRRGRSRSAAGRRSSSSPRAQRAGRRRGWSPPTRRSAGLAAVHRLRAGRDVRPVRADLLAGDLARADGDPGVRRRQAFVAEPQGRMARLILRDEVRPDFRVYTGNDLGHRHGDVRERLPARVEHLRPRPSSPGAMPSGPRATPASTS